MNDIRDKILKIIDELKLDLSGKVVLTEAATGAYLVTPFIAAAAGAKVFAFTKSSPYGTVEDVKGQTEKLAGIFENNIDITVIEKLTPEIIAKADIITNSGHLRPLNSDKLQFVKDNAVISYMYESWEVRKEDVDLDYCRSRGIQVIATNERHPDIDVFNYLGELAIKLIHDSGKCLYRNKFILISNNDFGPFIAKELVKLAEKVGIIDIEANREKYPKEVDWLNAFPQINVPEEYADTEAIIFTAYPFEQTWMAKDNEIDVSQLLYINNPVILRFAGHIDTAYLDSLNIKYYPEHVKPGHMGILLSDIGFDSVIRLQSGGLKAAELFLRNIRTYKEEVTYLNL
jgi:hypothetical protein